MIRTASFASRLRHHTRGGVLAALLGCSLTAFGALSTGCVAREAQEMESNTNWLFACAEDSQCTGGLSCQCGVCTRTCDSLECPGALSCVSPDACSADPSCQAECTQDDDCGDLATDARCEDGVCALPKHGLNTNQLPKTPRDPSDPETMTSPSEGDASGEPPTPTESSSDSDTEPATDPASDPTTETELDASSEPTDPATDPSTSEPASSTELGGDAAVESPDGAVSSCRYLFTDYAVGAVADFGDCSSLECTCMPDGTFADCSANDIECDWINIRACAELFPDLGANEPLPGDPILIESALIAANGGSPTLDLEVSYGGGCAEHDFALCQRSTQLGDQLELHLIHDGHADSCDAILTSSLRFGLRGLEQAEADSGLTWTGGLVIPSDEYLLSEHLLEACTTAYPSDDTTIAALDQLLQDEPEACAEVGVDESAMPISSSAASCIALSSRMDAGIAPIEVALSCDTRNGTLTWSVRNTLPDDGNWIAGHGDVYVVHAQDGTVLEVLGWGSSPVGN